MKILFGVFDWGIGHATRDIPLIEKFLEDKAEVDIISTGRALILLKNHFGNKCRYFDTPSLHNMYQYKRFFEFHFFLSSFKLIKSLSAARKASEKIIKKGNYDKVISDFRYDVYDRKDNSYFIGHQLKFSAPFIFEKFLDKLLAKKMDAYKYLIVPDYEKPDLSGMWSHNLKYISKDRIKYVGVLSHLRKTNSKKDVDYFISLSGPEETRKKLFDKIISQIDSLNGKVVITGGTPEVKSVKKMKNVEIHSFLDSSKQEDFMNRSKFVIIRAGYTTIMELAELEIKNALLIPSPGQTEQEYLTKYYEKKNYFHHVSQNKLNLKKDVEACKKFTGFNIPWKTKDSVKKFMEIIKDE